MPLNLSKPVSCPPSQKPAYRAPVVRAASRCAALSALLLSFSLCALSPQAHAQGSPGGSLFQGNENSDTLLDDPRPEGGWQGLANLLEKVKPSVDTRLQPSPQQVTDRIERLIASDRLPEALALVEKREAELEVRGARGGGQDVQLAFQHARLLARLGRTQEAIDRYSNLTTLYPELPEPWNNLAALHASRGELEQASNALQQALRANPDDRMARSNLADVQLMMAHRSYQQAGSTPKQIPLNPDAPASAVQ